VQINFGQGKAQFRFDLASKVQIYYRNIFDDIVGGDYDQGSNFLNKKQPAAFNMAKDYLHAQGYFKTLSALSSEQTAIEVI